MQPIGWEFGKKAEMLAAKVSVAHMKSATFQKKKGGKKVDERSLYFYIAERKYWVSVAIFSPKESVIESKWHNEKMSGKAWSSEKVAGIIAF